jgi:hypothetical protein
MSSPTDPLDSLFKRWGESTPHVRDSIDREVWRRIANAENRPAKVGWFSTFESVFSRPAFGVAFVAVCMLLGLFLAEVRLSKLHEQRSAVIEASYLQLLAPSADFAAFQTNSKGGNR